MTLVQINKKSDSRLNEAESKQFCRLQTDFLWILSHRDQLRNEYPGKYIAVENQSVRFVGNDINDLMSQIVKNNCQVDNFAIDFISKYPANLMM
jgi:hypothetical protein